MERIFVTGATGRVGSSLLEELAQHYLITALVRAGKNNLSEKVKGVKWITGDLTDHSTYEKSLAECDGVLHLAVSHSSNPDVAFRVNVDGTRTLVNVAHAARVKKILVFSSVMATQTYRNSYGESKRAMEEMLRELEIPLIVLRPSPIYSRHSPVLQGFEKYCTLPLPFIPLMNGGRGDLRPIALSDVSQTVVKIFSRPFPHEIETYDLCSDQPFSLRQTIELICQVKGIHKPIIGIPHHPLSALYYLEKKFFSRPWSKLIQFAGIGEGFHADSTALVKKYGLSFIPPREGIRACLS